MQEVCKHEQQAVPARGTEQIAGLCGASIGSRVAGESIVATRSTNVKLQPKTSGVAETVVPLPACIVLLLHVCQQYGLRCRPQHAPPRAAAPGPRLNRP